MCSSTVKGATYWSSDSAHSQESEPNGSGVHNLHSAKSIQIMIWLCDQQRQCRKREGWNLGFEYDVQHKLKRPETHDPELCTT